MNCDFPKSFSFLTDKNDPRWARNYIENIFNSLDLLELFINREPCNIDILHMMLLMMLLLSFVTPLWTASD